MATYSDTPDRSDREQRPAAVDVDQVLDEHRAAGAGMHLVSGRDLRRLVGEVDDLRAHHLEHMATELRLLADDPDHRAAGVAYISAWRLRARADQLRRR